MPDETFSPVGHLLTVERVTKATRLRFSEVLQEAARALEERKQPLWAQTELTPEALREVYANSEMYLGVQEGKAVAGMILLTNDPLFWPDVQSGESLFIHKLAVVPLAQEIGISVRMLAFAYAWACALGKRYLRLDTAAERPRLRAFYEKHRFIYVGERRVGLFDAALYEQEVIR